jgi:hypothetical protein
MYVPLVQLLILYLRGLALFALGILLEIWTDSERGSAKPPVLYSHVSAAHIALTAIVTLGLGSLIATLTTVVKYTTSDLELPA